MTTNNKFYQISKESYKEVIDDYALQNQLKKSLFSNQHFEVLFLMINLCSFGPYISSYLCLQFSIRLSQSASNASHESNLGTLSLLLRNRDRICHEEDVTNTPDHTLRLRYRLAMIRQIENHIW